MSIIKNLVATCINCAEENDVLTIGIGMTAMIQKIYHYRTIR
jgi:hypothetical protein